MTEPVRHLLGVWNPSYEADAMVAHIAVLLKHARAARDGKASPDDVYVWWGKLRSPYKQEPLPHLSDILALDEVLKAEDDAVELHLYLTDYRSLNVAHVGEITAADVLSDSGETRHLPSYYRTIDRAADCWFWLWDIRPLVLDDTTAVMEELRRLRNTRYANQRVSLYGGMVDLPLIVTRVDAAHWFEEDVRERLT
jgi:hypothetical protein